MKKPWFPFDGDWWESLVLDFPKPWTQVQVLADLRWWENQEKRGLGKVPGRVQLQERWGVSRYKCTEYLYNKALWTAPVKDLTSTGRRADAELTDFGRTSDATEQSKPEYEEKSGRTSDGDLTDFGRTSDGDLTGLPESTSSDVILEPLISNNKQVISNKEQTLFPDNSDKPTEGKTKKKAPKVKVEDTSKEESALRLEAQFFKYTRSKQNRTVSDGIRAVLNWPRSEEEISKVINWMWTSKEAESFRLKGFPTKQTPWRPSNFDGYLEDALRWEASFLPESSAVPVSSSPKAVMDVWPQVELKLRELSGILDPAEYRSALSEWPTAWVKAAGKVSEFQKIILTGSEWDRSQAKKNFLNNLR